MTRDEMIRYWRRFRGAILDEFTRLPASTMTREERIGYVIAVLHARGPTPSWLTLADELQLVRYTVEDYYEEIQAHQTGGQTASHTTRTDADPPSTPTT